MFDQLIALSQETSSTSRADLLKSLSGLFADGVESHTDRETELFADILCRLIDQVSIEARAELSHRLAPLTFTPHAVALRLATDAEREVFAVMLEHSVVLTDADLRAIASSQSQGHLLAITRRKGLSERVTDVLAIRGNAAVLIAVTDNASARFSEPGVEWLVMRGIDYPKVLMALSQRADMPRERLVRAMAMLDADARARLENLVALAPRLALMLTTEASDSARWKKERLEREIASLIRRVKQGYVTLDDCIARFAREGRIEVMAELLTQATELEEAHIAKALARGNDLALAVVCRSLSVSNNAYLMLAHMLADHLGLTAKDARSWAKNYAEVDRASAVRALRFHRMQTGVVQGRTTPGRMMAGRPR
ncbi:DUF2336 domain-containing protein [Pleomorphomonas oryzae]|uniref:DUF2336 domain-containing protein n=1 Tax=Pleomorphomonas oryzae TaxID=261934 RepID=UPI000409CD34|nr:DUF2336 domain-containing protein [Pleomorphomonas oryzae]